MKMLSQDPNPISGNIFQRDRLHRRNPQTVRQEIQSFDDLTSETTLPDIQLNELPGLQDPEQWKRIAVRNVPYSPPLSRQYYQTSFPIFPLQNGPSPQLMELCHPGETEPPPNIVSPTCLPTTLRRVLFGLTFAALIITIIVVIVVAVILIRRANPVTTDYYSGYIRVQARFDTVLFSYTSTLARNYQREFCSLIETTLSYTKSKYELFYSTCIVKNFRNGSIISDFTLGFTRYLNVTRLNTFFNRTLVNRQLFGGTIQSITFNSSNIIDANSSNPDNIVDYDI